MLLIVLAYLGGVITILSPCILPVLPFVFSRAQQSFYRSGLPLLIGMCLTFSLLSALVVIGGTWIASVSHVGRIVALICLTVLGLSLIFPQLAEKWLEPFSRLGAKFGNENQEESMLGSFLVGVSTGLLWAPCAGPILGLVLTGAATRQSFSASLGLLIAYSLGAATSLALALLAGNRVFAMLKKSLRADRFIKTALGVAVLLGVVAIAFNLDRTVLTRLSKLNTEKFETKLLGLVNDQPERTTKSSTTDSNAELPIEGLMPDLSSADAWLNSKPLNKSNLAGKVVLIDFWTYSCINCLRTLPYVKAWAQKYAQNGLVVIGVHTPEFPFERDQRNVANAVRDLGITYPVALDNEYKIWDAVGNQYWPAHYFIDRQGRIRHHHFGEGEYDESERVIRELLAEDGEQVSAAQVQIEHSGVEADASGKSLSPETYLGYARMQNLVVEPTRQRDRAATYQTPRPLSLNEWSLQGRWKIEVENATLLKAGGKIIFRFQARDLHLVLGNPEGKPIRFKVTIDGAAPGADHGVDTAADGTGVINGHRLYQLVRQHDPDAIREKVFEIEFLDTGVQAFAFTFG